MSKKFLKVKLSTSNQEVYIAWEEVTAAYSTGFDQCTIYLKGKTAPLHLSMNIETFIGLVEELRDGKQS